MTILPGTTTTLPGRSKIYKRHSCRGITPSGKSSIQAKFISEEWEELSPRVHFHYLITRIIRPALFASSDTLQDSSWCPDSGATDHVTLMLKILLTEMPMLVKSKFIWKWYGSFNSTCWSFLF
ncbi:hypothetical protein TorRG33x02_346940 [Trema orientale]|uniref:Uncharacterized protein n=1 Tax=Trema orientale TaxID=63057 RepID=A0A2P5AM88_TREOI|nr:hypothetical protein TorRG33x02_346940 [Trema orientale]